MQLALVSCRMVSSAHHFAEGWDLIGRLHMVWPLHAEQ